MNVRDILKTAAVFFGWRSVFMIFTLLALRPVTAADAAASAPIPDTLPQRMAACTACHGDHGEGAADSRFFPRLAGKPASYLARQLHYFQSGQRRYAPMQYITKPLSPAYMREMAEYFSVQQVPYKSSPVPTLPTAVLQRGEQIVMQGNPSAKLPHAKAAMANSSPGWSRTFPGWSVCRTTT